MSVAQPPNAIYFPEGAGYLLVKVLQTRCDSSDIESNVILVKSLDDNKLYVRKTVELTKCSLTGIPNEIEFNPSFELVPRVKDVTKYVDSPSGDYYWAICTEFCNGGDLRGLLNVYCKDKRSTMPEILVWKFIADFCKILSFLSENKIRHKDMWPQNIFLRYSDENPGDCFPDFVLGDFGWAVPLTESNQTEDMALFCCRLWEMCVGTAWNGEECDPFEHSHLSRDLREHLNHLIFAADDDELTIDFLVNYLLPHAEANLRKLSNLVPIKRHLSSLPATCKTDNGKLWPRKVECLVEDWQLAHIQDCSDGSGKLSIQGLPRTTLSGKRDLFSFIRCTPTPVSLDLVHRFDARNAVFPPIEVKGSGETTFTTGVKIVAEDEKVAHRSLEKPMHKGYPRKRLFNTSDRPSSRKKSRLHKYPSGGPTAKVKLNTTHPIHSNALDLTREEEEKVEELDEALVRTELNALRKAVDLLEAMARSEEITLTKAAALTEVIAQSEADARDEGEDGADDLSDAEARNDGADQMSPASKNAAHLSWKKALARMGLMTGSWFWVAASLLTISISLVPHLV